MKSRQYPGVRGPTFFPVYRRYRRSIAVRFPNVSHHRLEGFRISYYHYLLRFGGPADRFLRLHFHACGWYSSLMALPDEMNSGFEFVHPENHVCSYDNLHINATSILLLIKSQNYSLNTDRAQTISIRTPEAPLTHQGNFFILFFKKAPFVRRHRPSCQR